jgi:hypothetical protein
MAVPMEFTVTKDKPGVYELELNGQKTYFTIIGTAAVTEYIASPAPVLEKASPASSTSNTRVVSYAIMGLLILIAMVLLVKYLKTR